jgi:uncharacterized membrane protein YdjX (TVP38/TMEM64 family)
MLLPIWPPLGGFILLATLTSLGPWLRNHGIEGLLIYFLLTGFLMGVSFVPTYSCAILAGWAFGFAIGFPLAVVTITVAGMVAYALGRWIARDRVLDLVMEQPKWAAVVRSLLGQDPRRTLLVVTLLRIPPQSPFAIVNFALAAAKVRLFAYSAGTFLGVIPRTALACYAAAQLEQLRFKDIGDRWTLVFGLVATVGACTALGVLGHRALRSVTAPPPASP